MPNVFDWDDAEETKKSEKNMIFGDEDDSDAVSRFMKKSMVAANMNIGEDLNEYEFPTTTITTTSFSRVTPKQNQTSKTPDVVMSTSNKSVTDGGGGVLNGSKPRPSSGVSVRGHFNTSTQARPSFTTTENKSESIDDVVNRETREISTSEYKRLQDDLRAAKKTIAELKRQKWINIPVQETIQRIATGQAYTLDGYKSMSEKKGLLSAALNCNDGNAELKKSASSRAHYVQHLRKMEEWRKLEQFYDDMGCIEDAAILKYEQANKIIDSTERTVALQQWLNKYGESKHNEVDEMKTFVLDEIKLIEKQRQIEAEDKPKELGNSIMLKFPRTCIELRPLITTLSYCALYHSDKLSKFRPEEIRKNLPVLDKQFEWAVITPLAKLGRWTDVQELLTSTKWFGMGKKSEFSYIGFDNVVKILHKTRAHSDVLMRYANLIANQEVRFKLGKEFKLHDVAIDACVQLRDRQRLEQYRNYLGSDVREYQQKINNLLHNTNVKWR